MIRTLSITIFFLLLVSALRGQEKTPFLWGLEADPFISYSGYNIRLGGLLKMARHEVYAGPKLIVSDSYLPERGPWGLQLGYRYIWVKENRWEAFVNIDYQLSLVSPYNPLQLEKPGNNQIHELHLAFGASWRLGNSWRLGSRIGTGAYFERNRDLVAQLTRRYSGYSNLISFFVTYII